MKCAEKHCRKKRAHHKRVCYSCAQKKYTNKSPIRQSYHNKKGNAKRDGHEFNLTFEQFEEFAIKVNLIGKRGRTKESYTIDRIDSTKGYTIDNIARLSYSDNSKKGDKKIVYDYTTGIGKIEDWNIHEQKETDPF